jgi:ATP synthase protein I
LSPPTPDPEDLEALGERLDEVHKREEARKPKPPVTSLGVAFRMGTELIAAVAVSVAIGWGLDWVFGTRPVFILIMFVLGAAAGMRNVIVLAKDLNAEMLSQSPPPPVPSDKEDD